MKINKYRVSSKRLLKENINLKNKIEWLKAKNMFYITQIEEVKKNRKIFNKNFNLEQKLKFEKLCNKLWFKEYYEEFLEKKHLKKILKTYERIAFISILILMVVNLVFLWIM